MLSHRPTAPRLARFCSLVVLLLPPALHAQPAPVSRSGDTLRLSLGEAVAIALRQNDDVGIAAAQVDLADALYVGARSNVLPQLRVNSSYLHVYESARGQAVGSVFNQPNTYIGSLNLSQTLFQGGRLVAATRAADAARQGARFDEREQRAQVTIGVQRAYLQALYTARIAELQARNLSLAADRLTQVEQFERGGRAARYDVLRARVERANIEPLAIQARNDEELALLDLKRVLNVPADQPVALVSRVDSAAAAGLLGSVDTTGAADRASVRSAELNVSSRELGIRVARADYFPTVTAFVQQGYQAYPVIGQGIPTAFGAFVPEACPPGTTAGKTCQNGGYFSDRQLGLNVSFPVFDGLRVKSNVDAAAAQTRLAELQLRQTREAVSVDVARARAELRRAASVFSARQQNSAEADEAFRLATLRFSRGLSTQLEVSDAQLALLTAQSTEARATYDLFLASSDLARALGRPIPLPSSAAAPAPSR